VFSLLLVYIQTYGPL
jgi:hypothetical protein